MWATVLGKTKYDDLKKDQPAMKDESAIKR